MVRKSANGQANTGVVPMLAQCWTSGVNGGPTLNQLTNCLLGGMNQKKINVCFDSKVSQRGI